VTFPPKIALSIVEKTAYGIVVWVAEVGYIDANKAQADMESLRGQMHEQMGDNDRLRMKLDDTERELKAAKERNTAYYKEARERDDKILELQKQLDAATPKPPKKKIKTGPDGGHGS